MSVAVTRDQVSAPLEERKSVSVFVSDCLNQRPCCKPALRSPGSAPCSLLVKLEIYDAQKLRVGKQDLRDHSGVYFGRLVF